MISTKEQRHFLRLLINQDIQITILGEETERSLVALCRDLSASGVAIEADEPLEVGTLLRLRIESASEALPGLASTVKVVRCVRESDDCYLIGAEICELE